MTAFPRWYEAGVFCRIGGPLVVCPNQAKESKMANKDKGKEEKKAKKNKKDKKDKK